VPFTLVVPELDSAAASERVSLPALERLLSWSKAQAVAETWRAGLASDVGAEPVAGLAPAVVAAWPLSLPEGGLVSLATPVQLLAGISRVHLGPAGPLRLTEVEAREICDAFNQRLGNGGLRLHVVPGALLLHAESPEFLRELEQGPAGAGDPALLAGAALEPSMLGTSQALRRLAVETQMVLHEHPVNRAREQRGEPPVSLWFWGAGRAQLPPAIRCALPPAFAEEAWMSGLWRSQGGALLPPLPRHSPTLPEDALVLHFLDAARGREALQDLERDWFDPLLQRLEGGMSGMRLRLGRRAWLVRRPRLLRWRRRRAWWQQVGA
jgi:hypothetical protein